MEWLNYLTILNVIEILILAVVYYYVIQVLRGTRGMVMICTVIGLLLATWFTAKLCHFHVLEWLLEKTVSFLPFFIVVVLQPEIRRLLTMVQARTSRLQPTFKWKKDQPDHELTSILLPIVRRLSSSHTGGLIAIEQKVGLGGWAVSGAMLNAPLRANPLLETIFYEGSPLHDGGVIIRKREIVAAGCIFPLVERADGDVRYGTRHQAAVGLSEQSDAIVIVVSEETGRISLAVEGTMWHVTNIEQFRDELNTRLLPDDDRVEHGMRKWFSQVRQGMQTLFGQIGVLWRMLGNKEKKA